MKIEENKLYRTRDGRKVGPMVMDRLPFCSWHDGREELQWLVKHIHQKIQVNANVVRDKACTDALFSHSSWSE